MQARQQADDLLRRIVRTPALLALAVNPLLLTMITTVHRYRSSLPGRRVELYAEICEVFLGKRQQSRGIEIDMTPAQKQSVLQPLAYKNSP
jgi:predicted NACHT family NTPase